MHPGVAMPMRPVSRILQHYTTCAELQHVFQPEPHGPGNQTEEVMLSPDQSGGISSRYTVSNVAASSFVAVAILRCSAISLAIADKSSSRSKIPFRNNSATKTLASENAAKLTASSLMCI